METVWKNEHMSMANALLRTALVSALILGNASARQIALADCFFPPDGRIVTVVVESCEAIDGRTNVEVLRYVGANAHFVELETLYTGALVSEAHDVKWMYPSTEKNPCQKFTKGAKVKMRAYLTCCDTGRWGKCVFGGRWLGEIDGKPINSSQ
jgi:hypothetical protein